MDSWLSMMLIFFCVRCLSSMLLVLILIDMCRFVCVFFIVVMVGGMSCRVGDVIVFIVMWLRWLVFSVVSFLCVWLRLLSVVCVWWISVLLYSVGCILCGRCLNSIVLIDFLSLCSSFDVVGCVMFSVVVVWWMLFLLVSVMISSNWCVFRWVWFFYGLVLVIVWVYIDIGIDIVIVKNVIS